MSTLKWHYGPMSSGKSTLALSVDYNLRACGREGVLFTSHDRSGNARISSRLGMARGAVEVRSDLDLHRVIGRELATGANITYVIADEAQFYTRDQIDQLGAIVDDFGIEVSAFGLATDFTSTLFPGAQRLFEIADQHLPLQLPVMCHCGAPARMNARIVNGVMVREGEQVVVGDTAGDEVRYVLLCRRHYSAGHHEAVPSGQRCLIPAA